MNIKRAKQEIINTVRAYLEKDAYGEYRIPPVRQRPILLMGPPGIGKTQIMEQIAGECDLALVSYTITHHTRQSAIGLPFIVEKTYGEQKRSVTEYTMSEIIASVYDRMEASGKREGLLFIDEINCVSETLAPAMLQFLQGKTFGNQAVPKGWIIVAAGNPPEYNRSVREFDVVTLDRVKLIPVEADYAVWKEYAHQAGIHGSILSYLDIRKDQFYRMETTVDGKQFVTARGWQDLSELIDAYERLGLTVDREVTCQYLQHPFTAKDFANYLALYYRYQQDYQIDEILCGKIRPGILGRLKFAAFDERFEVTGLLLSKLSGDFRKTCMEKEYVDELFILMKAFRDRWEEEEPQSAANVHSESTAALPGSNVSRPAADANAGHRAALLLTQLRSEKEAALQSRIRAGQNEKTLTAASRKILDTLDRYIEILHENSGKGDNPVALLRKAFSAETDALDQTTNNTLEKLEYAFDFMEAAFGESQEMVWFITELSVNSYAAAFLQENDCPRYFMYNKRLLFEERDAHIREELDAIRDLQVT